MRLDEKDMQPKSLKGKTFGKTIQEYRLRNGWTQDELSWRTGINRTHIGRIERDECVPTVSTIERLEDVFRLPRLTLLELKQKAVAKISISSETEAEVGMAFRDLEQQLIMNMTETELKYVSSAINAFTDLIKK